MQRPETTLESRSGRLARPLLFAVGLTLLLLGVGEIVERAWLAGADMNAIHLSHAIRGILSSLLVAGVVGWMIISTSPGFLGAVPAGESWTQRAEPTTEERTKTYALWFIAMRWIAVLMAAILVFISVQLVSWLPKDVWWPLVSSVGTLAAFNVVCTFLVQRMRQLMVLLIVQAYVDLVILTVLLHFSGGIENPLSMMMIFHVIIGGILLSRRKCYWIAVVASVLFALLAWAEGAEAIEHYTLQLFPHFEPKGGEVFHPAHHPLYAASRVLLQAVVLLLTAYFVATLAERLRQNERRLESVADRAVAGQLLLEQALEKQKRTQAQVVRAGRLAAVGELASQVAHEVNNPIAIIDAKVRLLLSDHRGEMSPKIAQELGKVVDLTNRVARVAQGLLSFCRSSPATRTPFDIRQPVRRSLVMIESHARKTEVIIQDALPDAPLSVSANAQELEQVFLNLFLNAVDAMPQGGRLNVSATLDGLPDQPRVNVVVEDTGTGIPADIRDRIFEPFFTTKQEGRGTGLGLSICLGLVRSHGGDIAVESEPGRGSRFTVKLPLAGAAGKETRHG